jgi:hypothetical protein
VTGGTGAAEGQGAIAAIQQGSESTCAWSRPAPIYGPDGKYSDCPEVLKAAVTRVDNNEGITSLLYVSQRKG